MAIWMRGATAYEAQIGPLCLYWPYLRFMRVGVWPRLYLSFGD